MIPTKDLDSMPERRKQARYDADLPLELLSVGGREADASPSLVDVSLTGIGLLTTAAVRPGELVKFRLDIPNRGPVAGTGIVRWIQTHRTGLRTSCGVEFQSIGWGHAGRLRRYLEPEEPSPSWRAFDAFLAAACCVVGILIYREAAADPAAMLELRAFAALTLAYWPAVLGAVGAMIGLSLFLKR